MLNGYRRPLGLLAGLRTGAYIGARGKSTYPSRPASQSMSSLFSFLRTAFTVPRKGLRAHVTTVTSIAPNQEGDPEI